MKYDFTIRLKNLDGSDAIEGGSPATALKGFLTALVSDPQNTTAEDKAKRFDLFLKLRGGAEELIVEEVALLKKAIDIYPTLVYGQLKALLDQTTSI